MRHITRNKYMMLSTALLLIMVISWSYAFWGWISIAPTNVSVTVSNVVSIIYTKGDDITGATLKPTATMSDGIIKEIKVKLKETSSLNPMIDFYLDIVSIADELKEPSFKCEILRNDISVGSSNFSGVTNGDTLKITTTSQPVTVKEDTYTLYIWIDGTVDNPSTMSGQSFNFKLRAEGTNAVYKEGIIGPNTPDLIEGMIPIKYDGSTWVKADVINSSNDWYDYNNKKWANAVMVNEIGTRARAEYLSAPTNTVIEEDDILAYFVWIPRYKYQLFNEKFEKNTPSEIQIVFESDTSTTGTVSCSTSNLGVETCTNKTNGNWYTHPAFTFGNEELTGIWVGKFETSTDPTSSCYKIANINNCNNSNQIPKIKPNVISLRYQQVVNQFLTSKKFNSATYVTNDSLSTFDSHMMKNIEWGAVAYLTQSKYGRCTNTICSEMFINPSNTYVTGRSGTTLSQKATQDNSNVAATTLYGYDGSSCSGKKGDVCIGTKDEINKYGPSASTTGNIYGIYDISGGSFEYVMSAIIDETKQLYSGSSLTNNSGFTGIYTKGKIEGNTYFPNEKYYDKYEYGTSPNDQNAYNKTHLGDGIGETRSWNNDYANFLYSASPWLCRGGHNTNTTNAGSFAFHYVDGSANGFRSFRIVINRK